MESAIQETAPSCEPLEWQFSQVFGERAPNEEIQSTTAKAEFESIAEQLSTPIKNAAGSYLTWQFAVSYPSDKDKRSMDVFSDTDEASGVP